MTLINSDKQRNFNYLIVEIPSEKLGKYIPIPFFLGGNMPKRLGIASAVEEFLTQGFTLISMKKTGAVALQEFAQQKSNFESLKESSVVTILKKGDLRVNLACRASLNNPRLSVLDALLTFGAQSQQLIRYSVISDDTVAFRMFLELFDITFNQETNMADIILNLYLPSKQIKEKTSSATFLGVGDLGLGSVFT